MPNSPVDLPPRKILIADDDAGQRLGLESSLKEWGCEAIAVADGIAALKILQDPSGPAIAILDWEMPGIDGLQLCRWVREHLPGRSMYLILLTAHDGHEKLVEGLESGADDFLTKPFEPAQLRARIRNGRRIVTLHADLARKKADLRSSYRRIMRLERLLPICSYCKSVRDDKAYWKQIDQYLVENAEAQFSHGICPDCFTRVAREDFGLNENQIAEVTERSRQSVVEEIEKRERRRAG